MVEKKSQEIGDLADSADNNKVVAVVVAVAVAVAAIA